MNPVRILAAMMLLPAAHGAVADQLLPASYFPGLPACVPVFPVPMPKHVRPRPGNPDGTVRIALSFSPEGSVVERVILSSTPDGRYDEDAISAVHFLHIRSKVGTDRFRHCQMEVVFDYRPAGK